MAWDKNRPYAPFYNRTDYCPQNFGSMDSYGNGEEVTVEMIDAMYTYGVYEGPWTKRWNRKTEQWEECPPSYVWCPFKDVPLTLRLDRFEQRRAAGIFWWKDGDGRSYPMFAKEFNRLVGDGLLAASIDAVWSAEKRGDNYGIKLVRPSGVGDE